jgi:hypothetical protein
MGGFRDGCKGEGLGMDVRGERERGGFVRGGEGEGKGGEGGEREVAGL